MTLDEPAVPAGSAWKTVLVVDDQASLRTILVRVLQNQGYRVLSAKDGLDAIRQVVGAATPIDLVITDLMMPVMSGEEFLEYLAVLRPATKVICLSATIPEVHLKGGVLYLPKPFSLKSVAQGVADILAGVYGRNPGAADPQGR